MKRWQLAAAVVVMVAATAQAQRPMQPGGGRGQFGQQQPLSVLLLTNEALQTELKITDDQKSSLKGVMEKSAEIAKMRAEAFSGGQFDRTKMQEIQKEATALATEAKETVEKALTADQKKRIKQIDVQRMGMGAFANEDVVKELKITDEQKEKVKAVTDEYNKESRDLRTEYGLGGRPMGGQRPDADKMAEYTKKAEALTAETMEKLMKEMTAEQQKMWKDMTGEPFDVSKLRPQMRRPMN